MASRKKLLIVESPTKARTLKGYLGRGFEVLASKGHVKDLPPREFGVDLEHGFQPKYVTVRGKGEVLRTLRKHARQADEIYLASDPDREGEAIAHHIAQEIQKAGVPADRIHRILLFEITREAVREALRNPGTIDEHKVLAQQARRILDRIVGYKVSPLLWKVLYRGLSAGRVQTVALRLLVEREKEIQQFVPRTYWLVVARFQHQGVDFKASLREVAGEPVKSFDRKEDAEALIQRLEGVPFEVTAVQRRARTVQPPPPFKTSTLQQAANQAFGFPARRTMQLAQQLYEGVEIPGLGTRGLITYMRTDSVRLADKAVEALRETLARVFGPTYRNPRRRTYADRGRVQGAHEAIRPTDPFLTPEDLRGKLPEDLWKLYDLIWRRAVASQARPARLEITTVHLVAEDTRWQAEGRQLAFDGFYRILGEHPRQVDLPSLEVGLHLQPKALDLEERQTEPPPRYTEASLVKTLEELGIGRPSTYAPTIATLKERKYVESRGRVLVPTKLGILVTDLLIPRFPEIFDYRFTARMEEELDQVEAGERTWQQVLEEFYREFKQSLDQATEHLEEMKRETVEETQETCPLCGAPLVVKWGRYGTFLACSRFPECRYTRPLQQEVYPGVTCPVCGKPMVIKQGPHGRYLACVDYPRCRGTRPMPAGISCPKCGAPVIERRSKKGRVYYRCSNPACDFVLFQKPVNQPCPKCGHPFLVVKRRRGGKEVWVCPACKHEVKPADSPPAEASETRES